MKIICTLLCIFAFTYFVSAQSTQSCNSTCSESSIIDNCAISGMSKVSDFQNGILHYNPDNCTDGFCAGAVWRFQAINLAGNSSINATVTIDAVVNAKLEAIDDDAAADLNGSINSSLFAPAIKPDIALNGTDRKGYVQFTVRFFLASVGDGYSLLLNLANLSVYQYDLDGNNAGNNNIGNNGSWFRETGYLKLKEIDNPKVQFDAATEISAASYTSGAEQWIGGISSSCNKAGLTLCGQNTIAGSFSKPQYTVSFRLGYDYNAGTDLGQPLSQYGIKFGCFYIPGGVQLPVNLYEFAAMRKDELVQLSWATTYEQLNQGFRIQRKTDGEFTDIAFMPSQAPGGNSQIKLNYRYIDTNSFKGVSQYRIIQTDLENKIRVSEIRSVAGGSNGEKNILIYPNPATSGTATVVFGNSISQREVVLTNLFGQRVKQWNNITSNTLTMEKLMPGVYSIRITDKQTGEIQTGKFAVVE